MTDGGAAFQPGAEDLNSPYRPRAEYAGYRAFGDDDGAVLVRPQVTRKLRTAAEFATQERRIAGGLLYGRGWADEQGAYLVVEGYLEAGPGENRGDRISADGADNFTLSAADLRLLREDGARMYPSALEVGWWRTLAALGEFGPRDFETQAELVGPDGVGLLVYGSGIHWGTAYLGPDGHAPDSAGTLARVPDPADGALGPTAGLAAGPAAGLAPEPELVDVSAGESLTREPLPGGTAATAAPPRRRARRRAAAPVRVSTRRWSTRSASADYPGPETPADVQLVVGALIAVTIAAAIIIGVLVSNVIVAVIIGAIGLLAILSTVKMSRR